MASHQVYIPSNDCYRTSCCPGLYRLSQAADGWICRIKIDFGRLTLQQLHILADVAWKYGNGCIELTTRGNIQLRGIVKNDQNRLIDMITSCGLGPLVKAGDDIRNVMVNPTANFDQHGSAFVMRFAEALSRKLQTSPSYHVLPPKFSFYIDGGESCAILDHVSDIWLSITNDGRSFAFGIASCPPTNDNAHPPLGMVARERGMDVIIALLDCLFSAAEQNSSIQRMKNLTSFWKINRILSYLQEKIPDISPARSFRRRKQACRHDLGIHKTCFSERYYLGIKPPLGRFTPYLLYSFIEAAKRTLSSDQLRVTPWQSIIFPDCAYDEAKELATLCREMSLAVNTKSPYADIVCCTGLPGCHSACSDVQADARKLANALEGNSNLSLNFVACSKSCTSTQEKPVTLLAVKPGFYDIYYKNKEMSSKFGKLAASNVAIDDVTEILSQKHDIDDCKKRDTMFEYIRNGRKIYEHSFTIIRREIDLSHIPNDLEKLVVRVVHACGMVDLAEEFTFSEKAGIAGKKALHAGAPILCDSRMVVEGISLSRLPAKNRVFCTLSDPRVSEFAQKLGSTRSAAAFECWRSSLCGSVVVIGNAPTALFHLLEMLSDGAPKPALILGFPVGFVGAIESKEALIHHNCGVPYVTVRGRRGGSAMAAAAINALASEKEYD